MTKVTPEQIYIQESNIHILNSAANRAVFSNNTVTHGSDYNDFLCRHINRLFNDDAVKKTKFTSTSPVGELLKEYSPDKFVKTSRTIASMLYEIMEENVDIPSADLVVADFTIDQNRYLALLKMNYKETYGHTSDNDDVDILLHLDMIPSSGTLSEAAVINLSAGLVYVAEKGYEINGVKEDYFSERFLQCQRTKSDKTNIRMLNRIIDRVERHLDTDTPEEAIRIKDIAARELEDNEVISMKDAADIFFPDGDGNQLMKDLIEQADAETEKIAPVSDSTIKKLTTQEFETETGIRIIVPLMDERNKDNVAFSYDNGGSIIIKNAGNIKIK